MRNIYLNAFEKLQEEDHDKASEEFDEVKRQYRYSSWAAKAKLMLAYPSYRKQNFERAIGTLHYTAAPPSRNYLWYAYTCVPSAIMITLQASQKTPSWQNQLSKLSCK